MRIDINKRPPTSAELFGLNTKQNRNVKDNEKSSSENVKETIKSGVKNVKSSSKSSPKGSPKSLSNANKFLQEDEFIEPKLPTSGMVNVAIVKFTSDGKEYKFLISDKINFNYLLKLKEKQKYVAVDVWCYRSKKKSNPKKKQIGFITRIEKLDLDTTPQEVKPTSWVYKICSIQDNKKIRTNEEQFKFYKERKERRKNV